MIRTGLVLEPLDTLFFRDGRPFENTSRAYSGLPQPQTFAGAMRTLMLRKAGFSRNDYARLSNATRSRVFFSDALDDHTKPIAKVRFRGPWLALAGSNGGPPQPLMPSPSTLLKVEADESRLERIIRLDPLRPDIHLPGWSSAQRPLWTRENARGKQVGGYLTRDGIAAFLNGREVLSSHLRSAAELYDWDDRVGIGINPDIRSVEESLIYAIRLLALKNTGPDQVVLYAEVDCPADAQKFLPTTVETMRFGGEGRNVAIHPLPTASDFPETDVKGDGALVLLTSAAPTSYARPHIPAGLNPDNIVAMSVSGPIAFSGWDLARGGPKKTRFGVPSGSVYFLKESIRNKRDSLCNGKDALLGWGTFLEGSWSYA